MKRLGGDVIIKVPDATAASPLRVELLTHASIVPDGEDETTLALFRDGEIVPDCSGAAGTASPDPCVSSRARSETGEVAITALTSSGSVWSVAARAPTADAGGPYEAPEGGSVSLDASTSVGTDGSAASITDFEWDLDGDGLFGEAGSEAANGNEVGATPVFSTAGLGALDDVIIKLRITDTLGRDSIARTSVRVLNQAPVITGVTHDALVAFGDPLTVTVDANDPGGDDTLLILYDFDCDGDGRYETRPGLTAVGVCKYRKGGVFTIGVLVMDGAGATAVASSAVTVIPSLDVDAGGERYVVAEGGTVPLRGQGSASDGSPVSVAWDLDDDGTFETPGGAVSFQTGDRDGPGSQRACLRVEHAISPAVQACTTIEIENAPPSATFEAPPTVDEGGGFTLSLADAEDPSAVDRALGFEYAFDCGDGLGFGTSGPASSRTCTSDAQDGGTRTWCAPGSWTRTAARASTRQPS